MCTYDLVTTIFNVLLPVTFERMRLYCIVFSLSERMVVTRATILLAGLKAELCALF